MKKTDKKIISMLLVLIILISQCGMIFAEEITFVEGLEEYLTNMGVDENFDGKLSKEEWENVKNLDLYGSFVKIEGIENATNLKKLSLINYDLSEVDFSNFSNLTTLYIEGCELSGTQLNDLPELTKLEIWNSNLGELELSNLDNLEEYIIGNCGLEGCDFSKLSNLKKLTINLWSELDIDTKIDLNLSKLSELEILYINDNPPYDFDYDEDEDKYKYRYTGNNYIRTLDISGASNLKELYLYETYDCEIKMPEVGNIEYFYVDSNKIVEWDLSKFNKLKRFSISNIDGNLNEESIKLTDDFYTAFYDEVDKNEYGYINIAKKEDIEMAKNCSFDTIDYLGVSEIKFEESEILEVLENGECVGKEVGEEELRFVDVLGKEHTILVKVVENENDTTLENTGITAEISDDGKILKSNGELWEVNSLTTAEIIDTNVREYVGEIVYEGYAYYRNEKSNILYNNNKLNINYYGNTIKTIDNVKDVSLNNYITIDKKAYRIEVNEITEKVRPIYLTEAKEIIGDNFIVKNDGTTWESFWSGGLIKVFDFEIKDVKKDMWLEVEEKDEYGNIMYVYHMLTDVLIDENDRAWVYYDGEYVEVSTDELTRYSDTWFLTISKNNNAHLGGWYDPDSEDVEKLPLVLTNVKDGTYVNAGVDVLVRDDGSIWVYDTLKGLNKITKSTSIEKPESNREFIINPKIKEKKIENTDCITGLNLNENGTLTVDEFINQNNFNEKYSVKLSDSEGKELKGDSLIGTGTKVKLYQTEKLVKEYTIIIYGDVDGDAELTAADALTLIKVLNKKIPPESQAHVEAGKLSGETELTPADALRIIKHLNKKYEITQDI